MLNKGGRDRNCKEGSEESMKKAILTLIMVIILSGTFAANADTEWYSGHHEINDGDVYGEIWMHNDATADMWGGDVFQLGTLDSSELSMYSGTMDYLLVRGNSIVNIHSGDLNRLIVYTSGYYKYHEDDGTYEYIYDNGLVNLYAYDVLYHATNGNGWIDGKYIANDQYFVFEDISPTVYTSHINIVPEPTTFLLLGSGGILLRKRR